VWFVQSIVCEETITSCYWLVLWCHSAAFPLFIFRPHRSTTYVDAAYCYRPSSVVCRSVCLSVFTLLSHVSLTDQDAIWTEDSGGPREPFIRWGSRSPMGRGNFFGVKGRPIVKYRDTTVICAKTAEPIEMPFGLWALKDGVWVVGQQNADIVNTLQLRDVAMATIFIFLYMAIWHVHCRLANTTEPSVCGGDAALCQITLTTCSKYAVFRYRLLLSVVLEIFMAPVCWCGVMTLP